MKFEEPKMNVITFSAADIVTASGTPIPEVKVNSTTGVNNDMIKSIGYSELFD